ncbi:hypothetical protein LCGC14_2263600 [marine sediment metagenome]|uniref:Uncharacterized protein n=1 Tax=marine sediment metagenome TaxID=412755 RepID=A0A0F9FBB8_9ZZZZ
MEKIEFLRSDVLKIKVLKKLLDKKDHTPSELSTKLNTNGTTILRNCKLLELFNLIEIDVKKTKGINYFLKITEKGLSWYNANRNFLIDLKNRY